MFPDIDIYKIFKGMICIIQLLLITLLEIRLYTAIKKDQPNVKEKKSDNSCFIVIAIVGI